MPAAFGFDVDALDSEEGVEHRGPPESGGASGADDNEEVDVFDDDAEIREALGMDEEVDEEAEVEEEPEEEVEAADESKEDEKDDETKEEPKGRAAKRITGLVAQNKQLSDELSQLREAVKEASSLKQRFAETQQQLQHFSNDRAHLLAQAASMQKELELTRHAREKEERAKLDPVERLKLETEESALLKARAEYQAEVQKVRQENDARWKKLDQERNQERAQERINGYAADAVRAGDGMLEGLKPEVAEKLRAKTRYYVMNAAAAENRPPNEAAKDLERWAYAFVLGKLKNKSAANKAKLDAGKKVPAPLPNKKRAVNGKTRAPSPEKLAAMGYSDALEWRLAQENARDGA